MPYGKGIVSIMHGDQPDRIDVLASSGQLRQVEVFGNAVTAKPDGLRQGDTVMVDYYRCTSGKASYWKATRITRAPVL